MFSPVLKQQHFLVACTISVLCCVFITLEMFSVTKRMLNSSQATVIIVLTLKLNCADPVLIYTLCTCQMASV